MMNVFVKQRCLTYSLSITLLLSLFFGLGSVTHADDDVTQPLPVTSRMFLPLVASSGVAQQAQTEIDSVTKLDDLLAEEYELSPLQLAPRRNVASIVPSGKQLQILIPLYIYPNWYDPDNYVWDEVAAAASQVPITAIINPNSGPGSGPPNSDYVHGLDELRTAGVTLIGYVSTQYGQRPLRTVKAEIKLYNDTFDIDGVFLDEASNQAGSLSYYASLYNYTKSLPNLRQVVLNPGVNTDKGYFTRPAAETAVIFESYSPDWLTYTPDSYVADFAAERFAMLAHEVPDIAAMQSAVDLAVERNFDFVYLTDDLYSPNPWDSLPSFWADEVAYIAQWNAALSAGPGVNYEYYEGTFSRLPDFATLDPVEIGVVATFDLTPRNRDDLFAFRFSGCIQVSVNGKYTFSLTSDEGSRLYINAAQVVNNDGLHAPRERSSAVKLSTGRHRIQVTYFEKTGGEALTVQIAGPGMVKQPIPPEMLSQGC